LSGERDAKGQPGATSAKQAGGTRLIFGSLIALAAIGLVFFFLLRDRLLTASSDRKHKWTQKGQLRFFHSKISATIRENAFFCRRHPGRHPDESGQDQRFAA